VAAGRQVKRGKSGGLFGRRCVARRRFSHRPGAGTLPGRDAHSGGVGEVGQAFISSLQSKVPHMTIGLPASSPENCRAVSRGYAGRE
jgi:hypothetical protein